MPSSPPLVSVPVPTIVFTPVSIEMAPESGAAARTVGGDAQGDWLGDWLRGGRAEDTTARKLNQWKLNLAPSKPVTRL